MRLDLTEREAEILAEAALDELFVDLQRELGRLTREQWIAVERAIDRYRAVLERLSHEGRLH